MFTLHWQPPYDWTWMFSFLRARAVGGIETFSGNSFTRSMVVDGYRGLLTLTPVEQNHTLKVELNGCWTLIAIRTVLPARWVRWPVPGLDCACRDRLMRLNRAFGPFLVSW